MKFQLRNCSLDKSLKFSEGMFHFHNKIFQEPLRERCLPLPNEKRSPKTSEENSRERVLAEHVLPKYTEKISFHGPKNSQKSNSFLYLEFI